jgi:peptidoglycan/LPS O-acetylase OafA/YrhL
MAPSAAPDIFTDEWLRVALTGLPAALLIYGTAARDLDGKWPSLPILNALGDRSYALYLVHWPICEVAAGVFAQHLPDTAVTHYGYAIVAVWLSFVVTEALHRLVKRPSHNSARAIARRIGALAPLDVRG